MRCSRRRRRWVRWQLLFVPLYSHTPLSVATVPSPVERPKLTLPRTQDLGVRAFLLTNLERAADSPYYKFRLPLHHLSNAIQQIGDFPYSAEEAGASKHFDGPTLVFKGELPSIRAVQGSIRSCSDDEE